jgi:hypothetical protein
MSRRCEDPAYNNVLEEGRPALTERGVVSHNSARNSTEPAIFGSAGEGG